MAAPPVDGKANAEIERFLSSLLEVSRSEVAVVKGASGRDKLVFVRGTGVRDVRESLSDLVG